MLVNVMHKDQLWIKWGFFKYALVTQGAATPPTSDQNLILACVWLQSCCNAAPHDAGNGVRPHLIKICCLGVAVWGPSGPPTGACVWVPCGPSGAPNQGAETKRG